MVIKGLLDEDFVNYRLPSMFITTASCTFKCDKESGTQICQNCPLIQLQNVDIPDAKIVERYIANPITNAVIFSGLEPFDQYIELHDIISEFRKHTDDDIVIYTGYTEAEIDGLVNSFRKFPNIIIKFGRFIPFQDKHYDGVLGVYLASDNQYAKRIS